MKLIVYAAVVATLFAKSSTDETRKASEEERAKGIAALSTAITKVAVEKCHDEGEPCKLVGSSMMLSKGCDDIWDCLEDNSKDNVGSDLKKAICRPAAALIDNLNDSGFVGGKVKKDKGSLTGLAQDNKAGFDQAAVADTGMKTNSKGKVSKKATDKLGKFFFKAYECQTKPGGSSASANGKYARRRMARTYILN
jgi:hypothetical protein